MPLLKKADGGNVSELHYRTLMPAMNQIKAPNTFLQKRIFGNGTSPFEFTSPTNIIDLSAWTGDRGTAAPLVRRGSPAALIGGVGTQNTSVIPPSIRVKRQFRAYDLLGQINPGRGVHVNAASEVASSFQERVALDLAELEKAIVQRLEWMAAKAIVGTFTYTDDSAKGDIYKIDYQRPSDHTYTLGTVWDTAATAPLEETFQTAIALLMDNCGFMPQDCLMSPNAAAYFRAAVRSQFMTATGTVWDPNSSKISYDNQYGRDGVLYMGRFMGVDCWEYRRSITDVDGTSTQLIRADYIEFLPSAANVGRKIVYGAVEDTAAIAEGRTAFQTRRFAKTWEEEDPSSINYLAACNPLPILGDERACVSVKVH